MALRLRFAEEPLRLAYSLIGHGGRESGSFLSFYRMQQRLAEAIDNMPDTCHAVKGLRQKLRIAAKTVYTRAEETFEAMLVTPAHVAQRMKVFLPGGDALDAIPRWMTVSVYPIPSVRQVVRTKARSLASATRRSPPAQPTLTSTPELIQPVLRSGYSRSVPHANTPHVVLAEPTTTSSSGG